MTRIEQEIDALAARLAKSVDTEPPTPFEPESVEESPMKKGFDLILDTVMSLGPEGLKKALPHLTDAQKVLLGEALTKAKAAMKMETGPEDGQELIELDSKKAKSSKKRAGEADEDMIKPGAEKIAHQGDQSELDGQLVKGDSCEKPNEEKSEEMASQLDPKEVVKRMKERGLKKADCMAAASKKSPELAKAIEQHWGEEKPQLEAPQAPQGAPAQPQDESAGEKAPMPQAVAKPVVSERAKEAAKEDRKQGKKAPLTKEEKEGRPAPKIPMNKPEIPAMKPREDAAPAFAKAVVYEANTEHLLKASTRRGQNCHYSVEEQLLKSEVETREILAKGGYLNDVAPEERLEKAQKVGACDLIEKGLDMSASQIERIQKLHGASKTGPFTVQSFSMDDLAKSMGMSMADFEALEKAGAPGAKGEGSRGGKIIGHTRSGKPIYAGSSEAQHKRDRAATPMGQKVPGAKSDEHHKDYSLEDHIDAFAMHSLAGKGSQKASERSNHDRAANYHDEKIGQMTNGHQFTDEHKKMGREAQAHYERASNSSGKHYVKDKDKKIHTFDRKEDAIKFHTDHNKKHGPFSSDYGNDNDGFPEANGLKKR